MVAKAKAHAKGKTSASSTAVTKSVKAKAKEPSKKSVKDSVSRTAKALKMMPDNDADQGQGRGRPCLYKPEYCRMMREFFVIDVSREVEVKVKGGAETRYITNTFPTLTRFATKIGVSRDTLYEWASKKDAQGNLIYPEFSDALTCAQDMQETLMIEGGLSGHYESKFLTFLAPNISRLKNKVETVAEVNMNVTNTEKLDEVYEQKRREIEVSKLSAAGRAERLGLNIK